MMRDGRPSARARGYTWEWEKRRKDYLRRHPFCVKCAEQGVTELATVVDHVVPHKGDPVLFWDERNWQGLCETHHNSTKQSEERRGHVKGTDVKGRPLDANHPWNRARGPP